MQCVLEVDALRKAFLQPPLQVRRVVVQFLSLLLGRALLRLQLAHTSESGFDVSDHFGVELILVLELACGLQSLSAVRQAMHVRAAHVFSPSVISRQQSAYPGHGKSCTHASLCPSGMLASMLLISCGPKPVTVLLC